MVEQTVKQGYKQTDNGIIPDDWEVKKVIDFTDTTSGGTPSTFSHEYWGGSIKWMNSGELHLKKVYDVEGRITELGLKNSSTKILPKRCVLIGLAGQGKTRGTVAINYTELCTNQSIAAILPKESFIPEYLYYNLDSRYVELRNLSMGEGGRGGLNLTIIRNLSIPFPSTKEEQVAISQALSDVDALIESLDNLIEKKKNIKQGAMQALLTGKIRLARYSEKWEVKKLGDLAQIVSGGTPSTSVKSYWNGHIKWCTPTDITSCPGKYLVETERTITAEGLGACSAQLLPVGSLLLCSRATIGEIRIAATEICTNQGFKSLICKEGVNNEFLYYKMLTMKNQMIEKAIGSTFLELQKRDAEDLSVSLPPEPEQNAIALALSDFDSEIEEIEKFRNKYLMAKKGMMQQLLTGRTRLK